MTYPSRQMRNNNKNEIVIINMILNIFMVLLMSVITCGLTVDYVEKYAECMAQCQQTSCRDDCFHKKIPNKEMEISSEAANFNAELHCKDVDLLTIKHNPGIYFIMMEDESNTRINVSVTEGEFLISKNLQPATAYRYTARRFDNNYISAPEITEWFTTTRMGIIPARPAGVFVENILQDDVNDDRLMAEVAFAPGEDRSCFYEVLSLKEDEGLTIASFDGTLGFQLKLPNLGYHRNNTVIISAINNGSSKSSDNVTMTFHTPTCLEIHENITRCPPDQIIGLRVTDERGNNSDFDFSVSWNKPKFTPDNYTVQLTTIDQSREPYLIIVNGNSTGVSYSLKNVGLPHMLTIIAESPGGTTTPETIPIALASEIDPSSSSVLQEVLIVFPAVTLTAAVITMIYIYYRYKKMRNCRDPYRYCKNLHGRTIFNLLYEKPKLLEVENKIEDDPLITKDHFELGAMQLKIKDILGSGFSGVVRLGSLKINDNETIDVAVKMLRDCPSAEDIKNFQQEMMVMKSAGKHPNIVSLIGCCTSEIKPMIVVEYCSKGDLQNYLRNIWKTIMEDSLRREAKCKMIDERNSGNARFFHPEYANNEEVAVSNTLYDMQQDMLNTTENITAADLLSFALQIANGMKFLSLNRIVHRDLAARNVLVCGDRTVKISDFGLSRDIYQDSVYKKQGDGKLPLKWMAVEALTHQIYTSQSDVWSFGILLWEIVTLGSNPYPDTPTHMILQVLKTGYRMEKPSNCGRELYDIMLSCWRTSPRSRPTFTDLQRNLEKLLQAVGHHEYLNLYDIHQESRNANTSE
ncbi:tyrosine-protein kinase receptor torso isoform X2 [Fopius arisanus]|uniref:receptor protein-tyrosine kinase n=1 Tax=Fopius arisanus TaxID=64838 RepID=A0A9R1TRM8_9HYME|nr:PREDICTED: tyrosine-protein kinase receptor torso isoform X2 [Fopius arisanus]